VLAYLDADLAADDRAKALVLAAAQELAQLAG